MNPFTYPGYRRFEAKARASAVTHPTNVHPRKTLTTMAEPPLGDRRRMAMIDGRK